MHFRKMIKNRRSHSLYYSTHLMRLFSVAVVAVLLTCSFFTQAAPPKTLTVQVQGSGSVTLDPAGGSYARGTAVTMTAMPAEGWVFDHWEGATIDGYTNNPQVITMYNSYTVTAVFTQPTGISNIRKSDATIKVVDAQGQPVPNVAIEVDMTAIDFAFGTALTAGGLDYAPYRNWVKNNFNWGVAANEAKWYANEPAQGMVTYADADKINAFAAANNIKMRGHTVFWSVPDYVQDWVKNLPYPTELQNAVDARLESAVNHFAGTYLHWDVNNEMLHGSFFQDRLGESIRPYMFNRVKALDPNAKTFVNDYNILSGAYSLSDYVTQIQGLLDAGAQIDAIGVQGHFHGEDTMEEIKQRLDTLASLGLPIWITEYDYADADPVSRANYLEDFYRTAFGHPAVEGILMWGFWEGDHWRGADAALMESDFTVNAAGQRYESLRAEWWTNTASNSDANGELIFNGFHGDYQVTLIPTDGPAETHTIQLQKSPTAQSFTLQLGTGDAPDTQAPAPNPPTWASAPKAMGTDVIAMTATTASDVSGVEYYFANLSAPSHDSGWQNSSSFIDSGLLPGTEYAYTVTVRDKSLNQNVTSASVNAYATTLPDDGNLIGNGGFEYGTTAKWRSFAGAPVSVVTDNVHSGNYAGFVSLRAQAYDGLAQSITDQVTQGQAYQASAWVRLTNASSAPVSMTVRVTDQDGNSYIGVGTATANDTGWTELTGVFTATWSGTLEDLTVYVEGPPVGVDYLLDDVSISPIEPGTGSAFVNDIAMSYSAKGPNYTGTANVHIKDSNGLNVSGATVSGNWSGSVSGSATGTTAADGTVSFSSLSVKNGGTFTFTVTNVTSSSSYDPALNLETSDTITTP
jgi:GH35 family endo-1,4-beta-xylanase